MKKLYVGMDVDDQAFHIAGLEPISGEFLEGKTKPQMGALVKRLRDWRERGYSLHIFYESTYVGFSYCRALREQGFECDVVAASLIPGRSHKAKKTDRLDTLKLAEYAAKDLLQPVHIPDETEESERDIMRSRSFLVDQRRRLRFHILAICRRYDLNYRQAKGRKGAQFWTTSHRIWLVSALRAKGLRPLERNLRHLWLCMDSVTRWIEEYDTMITEMATDSRYAQDVLALSAYRGINRTGAMILRSEIGDITRFPHPNFLVSWFGLDIREASSGGKEKKLGITKMGNRHARTMLIEAAQFARFPLKVSRQVTLRRAQSSSSQIAIADRCMKRLYQKGKHLYDRGKHTNVIKTACAREMVGFLWESLMHQQRVQESTSSMCSGKREGRTHA